MREFVTGQNLGRWRESGPTEASDDWLQVVEGPCEVPLRHLGERDALPNHEIHAGEPAASRVPFKPLRSRRVSPCSGGRRRPGACCRHLSLKSLGQVLRQSYFANMSEPDVALKRWLRGTTTSCSTMALPE